MKLIQTPIKDLVVLQPTIFNDQRGSFIETWNKSAFKKLDLDIDFVQDNQSLSKKGVLRGLHFQNPPFEQGKLVRVIQGKVLDVAVDIRRDSVTYGKYFSIELSDTNNIIFWIPPGFAHGFLSLANDTIFSYKCTNIYNKNSEGSLLWNDVDLAIDWKMQNPIVSEKDKKSEKFNNFISKF